MTSHSDGEQQGMVVTVEHWRAQAPRPQTVLNWVRTNPEKGREEGRGWRTREGSPRNSQPASATLAARKTGKVNFWLPAPDGESKRANR